MTMLMNVACNNILWTDGDHDAIKNRAVEIYLQTRHKLILDEVPSAKKPRLSNDSINMEDSGDSEVNSDDEIYNFYFIISF